MKAYHYDNPVIEDFIAQEEIIYNKSKYWTKDSLKSVLCEIPTLLLQHMTGNSCITMCYTLFNTSIRNKHRIKIVGWPVHVPFTRPGTHERSVMDRLLHAWRSGQIQFVRISWAELRDIQRKEKGALVARTRAVRSDKGLMREPNPLITYPLPGRRFTGVKTPKYVNPKDIGDDIEDPDSEPEAEASAAMDTKDEIEDFSD